MCHERRGRRLQEGPDLGKLIRLVPDITAGATGHSVFILATISSQAMSSESQDRGSQN
jgi:hypothetical protein